MIIRAEALGVVGVEVMLGRFSPGEGACFRGGEPPSQLGPPHDRRLERRQTGSRPLSGQWVATARALLDSRPHARMVTSRW